MTIDTKEIDVSCLLGELDPFTFSHSAAEAGEANKWSDALDASAGLKLDGLTVENGNALARSLCFDNPHSYAECVALVLQYAAGDLRELQSLAPGDGLGGIDWKEAEALSEAGTCGGRLFVHDDKLLIYIGE